MFEKIRKGFRKPNKKALRKMQEVEMKERQDRAQAFLKDYQELIKKHGLEFGVEVKAVDMAHALFQGQLLIKEYKKPEKQKVTAWSNALRNNLKTRMECKHKLNEEGISCEKCQLPPAEWDDSGTGATEKYIKMTENKIKVEEEKEAKEKMDCLKGEHIPNQPSGDIICEKCLMPKEDWAKNTPSKEKNMGEEKEEVKG